MTTRLSARTNVRNTKDCLWTGDIPAPNMKGRHLQANRNPNFFQSFLQSGRNNKKKKGDYMLNIIAECTVGCVIDRATQIQTILVLACGGGWYKFACIDEAGKQYFLADKVGLRARGIEQARVIAQDFATNPKFLSDPGMKHCTLNRSAS